MTTSHKHEALMALESALTDLEVEDEITGFLKSQIRASVLYAKEQIDLIQELKRPRKAKSP